MHVDRVWDAGAAPVFWRRLGLFDVSSRVLQRAPQRRNRPRHLASRSGEAQATFEKYQQTASAGAAVLKLRLRIKPREWLSFCGSLIQEIDRRPGWQTSSAITAALVVATPVADVHQGHQPDPERQGDDDPEDHCQPAGDADLRRAKLVPKNRDHRRHGQDDGDRRTSRYPGECRTHRLLPKLLPPAANLSRSANQHGKGYFAPAPGSVVRQR